MRPIKFRGKSLNTGRWVYGDLQHKGKRSFIEYEVDPATVGQYTGLKDKTGQEIYEGDILKVDFLNDPICVVRYYKDSFMAYQHNGLGYYVCKVCGDCIVIGNVHNYPELMKGGEQ